MLNIARDDGRPISPKEKKVWEIISKTIPYLLLFAATFVPFAIFFKTGDYLQGGDDSVWHRMWSWDLSYGFTQGFLGNNSPSHALMGNLGLGVYLFYGPLCHYMIALLHYWIPAISINWSIKICTLIMTYLSGMWMYWLGKKITHDDLCGLMLGLAYIFMPYRINCILYRAAYPEAFAMSFIPLLFLGVHNLGHADFRPATFVHCVLGVSCLVLCHPFTALISVIAAAVYLLCCWKWIVPLFKNKWALIYAGVSVLMVFCLIGWYFFPMMHYMSSGLYIVNDAEAMWTNLAHCAASTGNSSQFSGFLRPDWIDYLVPYSYKFPNTANESWLSWSLDYVDFAFFGAAGIAVMEILSRREMKALGASLGAGISLLCLVFTRREEMFLVVPLFAAVLLFIGFSEQEKWDKKFASRSAKEELKSPEIYWVFILFIFSLCACYVPSLWNVLPSIFYNAQFAWRFWSLVLFCVLLLVAFIVRPFAHTRIARGTLAILATMSFLSCMGPIDKRFVNAADQGKREEPSLSLIMSYKTQGVQNEYVPQVFKSSTYTSEYSNSLYKTIRNEIYGNGSYQWTMEDYLDPAFLEGTGSFDITSLNSPEATFDVTVTSAEALVQMPQFYYEGYVLELTGTSSYTVSGINVDGLVSFRVQEGTYKAALKWKGLTSYRVFSPLFYVGVVGTIAMVAVPAIVKVVKKKKELPQGGAKA